MSAAHNADRLEVEKQEGSELFKVTMQGICFGRSLTLNVARRLAACWNACEGIATEVIEKKQPVWWSSVRALTEPADRIAAELDTASTLLSDALETFDEDASKDHEVADRIRAFLKGGAA